jgi:hypothetical protein
MTVAAGSARRTVSGPTAWIYGRGTDLFIAWCWVPVWFVGHAISAGHDDDLLRRALGAAFLLSFMHQPLTLGLVYGDARQFNQRRRLFLWAPVVTVAVVWVALTSHLWVVIPIAAVWNTVHTLQQRYGLSRIYARKSGYGSAFLDRAVLYAWMGCAVVVVAASARTTALVRRIGLDGVNAGGVRLLTDARPVALLLLVPLAVWAVAVTAALVRQEAGEVAPNRAKWGYQSSSLLLITALAVDPAAGFIAYVAAHAIEYFVVVYKTTASRYGMRAAAQPRPGGPLPWVARSAAGRVAALVAVAGLAFAAHARLNGEVYDGVLYTVGILHFLYDGFIWKLRKPAVASDFAIPEATPGGAILDPAR